jgi:glycosyltransferase involved in cell wall biosynthesis
VSIVKVVSLRLPVSSGDLLEQTIEDFGIVKSFAAEGEERFKPSSQLEDKVHQLEKQVARLSLALREARRLYHSMSQSLSWKLTWPALGAHLSMRKRDLPKVYESDVIFVHEKADDAEVSVVAPLYNYAGYVAETLDSVFAQSLNPLDLVIFDGCSTDDSLAVAKEWAERNVARFSRLLVLKNQANYGLAFCRNSGFDAAESPCVLPLDAANKLLPNCCENLLRTIRRAGAAYVYPIIQQFGGSNALMGTIAYNAQRFVEGNHFDAMALVSKEAWAMVGGYDHVRYGWEDYDFWCRIAELGLYGEWHPEVLAEYRVHPVSMLKKQTLVTENYRRLHIDFKERHPWVSLIDQETSRRIPRAQTRLIDSRQRSRIDLFFPILRCPQTHQKLTFNEERSALVVSTACEAGRLARRKPFYPRRHRNSRQSVQTVAKTKHLKWFLTSYVKRTASYFA